MNIDKTAYLTMLYDFYGILLTPKQKDYLELYYEQDLSLGEISQELGVSRQAAYDNIKRSEMLLKKYEAQLQLIKQHYAREDALQSLRTYISEQYQQDEKLEQLLQRVEKGE